MAGVIQIILNAVDNASSTIKKTDASLNGLAGSLVKTLAPYASIASLGGAVVTSLKMSMQATVEYADQVRALSEISGTSTEESSRFIQVLDDYKISANDAMTATRALTKEGLTPSIETLAKLSDEYLKANTAQEKNELILKNLGRSGLQWVEVLNKGSKAILEQGAAVDKSLILSQKAVDEAREYEIALDNWNDSVQGLKIAIGSELLPVLTSFLNGIEDQRQAVSLMNEEQLKEWTLYRKMPPEIMEQVKAEREKETALMLSKGATEQNTEAVKANEDAIKAITQANKDYLSLVGDMTTSIDDYKKSQEDLWKEHDDLLAKKQELLSQGYWPESEAVQEINDKLAENSQKQQDNAAAFELASRTRILSMLEEQLAAGGLSEAETTYLLDLGLKWGVYSQTAVDEARKAQEEVKKLTDQFNQLPSEHTFAINFVTNGDISSFIGTNDQIAKNYKNSGTATRYASGGSFVVPAAYGYEGFNLGGMATASAGETVSISNNGKQGTPDSVMMAAMLGTIPSARENAKALVTEMIRAGIVGAR